MTDIVILGSRRFAPYNITFVPFEMADIADEEERFDISIKKSHPAMEQADIVVVYAPDGIGIHTQRDIDYARKHNKPIFRLVPLEDEKNKMSVMIWFPDSECFSEESTTLLKRLREAGLRVFVASFPTLTETRLFVDDSVYSGDKINEWLMTYIKEAEK